MNVRIKISLLLILLSVLPGFAQTDAEVLDSVGLSVLASQDSVRLDTVDFPESMIISEDSILNDRNNRGLVVGEGVVRDLTFTDEQLAERLSRIPTTIDLPLNNITREYIDAYCNRKSSVAAMLGSSNFYMPMFEEALEKYGLPSLFNSFELSLVNPSPVLYV